MKRLFTSVLSFLMAFSLWAEAPQTISYQAVVRNNQGRLLRETNVGVRITILQEHENGHSVYTETRTVKTNVNGLMTFAIGDANGFTSDTLSNIAWADNNYFLRCDIDLDGGENYTLSSTSQMNSVPYALYAKNIAPEALPTWAQSEDKPVYNYSEIQDAPEVPTKVSELENDANYITINELPKADSLLSKSEASITYQPKGNYLTEHQSLAGYVTKAEASETYQPKGNYLTEHQSLADYAKKSDLPKKDSLLSKAEASTTYQPKGNYLTEHQSLADYAKKSELPKADSLLSKSEASSIYQPKGDYLTEHQSLAGYVTKAEASETYQPKGNYLIEHQSLAGYVTKAEASTTYQPKGNYLTEHQSLADYAKKTDIPSVPTNVSDFTNDAGYITAADIPTVQVPSLTDYAKKSDLPKKDSLLSKAEASTTYQPKGNYLTEHQSLAGYVTKAEASTTYQPKGNYLTEHQSLADYAKKSDLPKKDSLLSKAEASTTYQPKGEYLTEHQSLADYAKKSEIPTVPTKVSSFTNDAGYLTEHQSLADYAKKSELPTVPTNVSSFTNDAGYLTEHQSLADYAKKSEIPSTAGLLSEAKAAETYQPKGSYLTEHQSLAGYATKSELPKADSLLSKAEASTTYQPKGNYLTEHQSLTDYAKKTDIPTVPTKVSQLTNDANYAKKSELPSTAGLLSETKAAETYQPKGNYLTEHQSLAVYAKKTDIPTKVSAFENDATYIKKADFDAIIADYNTLLNKYKTELDSLKTVVANIESGSTEGGTSNNPSLPGNGTLNGYEYVDLGLPSGLKWATMNVGATKPEEYGSYFYGYEPSAAAATWGNQWRCPSSVQFHELLDNCTWTWTSLGGVNGYKVASKVAGNNNWIFLPADSNRDVTGSRGDYWSSTVGRIDYAFGFRFTSSDKGENYGYMYNRYAVRPVTK